MARMLKATIEGRTYKIPEIWIAGFCQGTDRTVQDAVQHWHVQTLMAESLDERMEQQ